MDLLYLKDWKKIVIFIHIAYPTDCKISYIVCTVKYLYTGKLPIWIAYTGKVTSACTKKNGNYYKA